MWASVFLNQPLRIRRLFTSYQITTFDNTSKVQHCHAVRGNGELFCVSTNAEMFEMLSEDISRGRKGIVPYSEEAIQLMERETKARESFLKSR